MKTDEKYNRIISVCFPLSLSIVFLISTILKIFDFREFTTVLAYFPFFLTFSLVKMMAGLFILFEFLIAILLLSKKTRLFGLVFSLMTIGFFIALSFYSIINGITISCGCFGEFSGKINEPLHIVIIFVMLVMNVIALLAYIKSYEGRAKSLFQKQSVLYLFVIGLLACGPIFLNILIWKHNFEYKKYLIHYICDETFKDTKGVNLINIYMQQERTFLLSFVPRYKADCDYKFFKKLNDICIKTENNLPVVCIFIGENIDPLSLRNLKMINNYFFHCMLGTSDDRIENFIFKSNPFTCFFKVNDKKIQLIYVKQLTDIDQIIEKRL